jgi:hypothetical protein
MSQGSQWVIGRTAAAALGLMLGGAWVAGAAVDRAAIHAQTAPSGVAQVDARLGWQSTGLVFQPGMPLRAVVTSGEWTYWIGGSPMQPGTGDDYVCTRIMPREMCIEPMPAERKGALIGRIGQSLFRIGQQRDLVAGEAGVLDLRMNDPDSALGDNDGILTVAINPVAETPTPTPFVCPPGMVCITWTPVPVATDTPTPTASPSPTPTATPSVTTTSTRTVTPSITPSLTPSHTPTPLPPAPCAPITRPVDTVLVLDRSSSMDSEGKLEAARQAIGRFIDAAAAPPGRLALVTFAGVAGINQSLTDDKARVKSALQAVRTGPGTRIDLGLREARAALAPAFATPGRAKVIILLSDGMQNGAPAEALLVEAELAKAAGAIVFTIGLGADVDTGLLKAVATSGAHYFFAPRPADLAAIYQQVTVAVPCSALGGQVYIDRDADGRYDPAVDVPLADVTVRLDGPAIRAVRSDSSARRNYRFEEILAGRYTVRIDAASLPGGLAPSSPDTQTVDLGAVPRGDVDFGFLRAPQPTTPPPPDPEPSDTPTLTGTQAPVTPRFPDPTGTAAPRGWAYLPWGGS